jgi:hypothetical protein
VATRKIAKLYFEGGHGNAVWAVTVNPGLFPDGSANACRSGRGLARYSEGRAYLLLPVSSGSASIAKP